VKVGAIAEPAVRALTDCSIGIIEYRELESFRRKLNRKGFP